MSSRKKLTVSLVAVALVVVAAVVAVVSVLAAANQSIKSTFSIKYTASSNVVCNVKAGYKLMEIQTEKPSFSGAAAIGSASGLEIDRSYDSTQTGNGILGNITEKQELKDEANKRALVF